LATTYKRCTKCRHYLEIGRFTKDKTRDDKHFPWCKTCVSKDAKQRYDKDPSIKRAYSKKWREEHPDHYRWFIYKYVHGVTKEQYEAIFAAQNGECAICHVSLMDTKRNLDHDHETGKIRQFLCTRCNLGIGNFHDNVEMLQAAIDYINRHRNKTAVDID
jgi:Recombination endonuclease VII